MKILLAILFSYLFGSIPWGLVIGKVFFHKDIRKEGSGNAGGTNAGRVLGKPIGVLVIALDALKGLISMTLAHFIAPGSEIYAGVACCIGHCFPCFAQFKGGKAVACFAGFILYTSPILFVIGLFLFLLLFKLSKRVSFASVITAPSMRLLSFIPTILNLTITKNPVSYNGGTYFGPSLYLHLTYIIGITYLFISTLLVLRHLSNIKRLEKGTEPETHFKD